MSSKSHKVLVVEDERPLAEALNLKLQRLGHKVTIASDGRQALDLLKTNQYDIILLDLMMPVMNGFELLEKLRTARQPMPPVFVLSNLTQPEDEARALELGAKRFLVKSDTPLSEIVDAIDHVS